MTFHKNPFGALALAGLCLAASAARAADTPPIVDLASGRPVAQALVVLTSWRRPFLDGLFSSNDPRRCVRIGFARSDAAGRVPAGSTGGVTAVVGGGVSRIAQLAIQPADRGFVLAAQRLQSSPVSERFGPGYATEAEANTAREAWLRSPDGAGYTAFTVRPAGAAAFQNFRMLQVKYVDIARGTQRYATEAEADAAQRRTVWTLAGPLDSEPLWDALGRCQDATLDGAALLPAVLDAVEAATPDAARTPLQREVIRAWRKRAPKP